TSMKPTIFIDYLCSFFRFVPIALHNTMAPYYNFSFFRNKTRVERGMSLYSYKLFGFHILYTYLYTGNNTTYSAINLPIIFGNRHNGRGFCKTKSLQYFNSKIAEKFANIFWKCCAT